MLSYILNNCSMCKYAIIFIVIAMIGFAVNENIVVTAQSNSTNSDKQKIIVMWLETNDTKTDTPVIGVSDEDFWKIFEPLLELSTSKTINKFG
jgi:hypothetical protein